MKPLLALLVLVLGAGCAAPPVAHDRLAAEARRYPAARYISGQGQGPTAGVARDRARADLAKVFEVAVRESSSDRLQWERDGNSAGLQASIRRDISLQTSQVIAGMEIAGSWRDPEKGDYFALAVLDRQQAAARLRTEIAGFDAETARNIERARGETNLPEKVSAAYNALQAQLQRLHPQKMLRIVEPATAGTGARYDLAGLKSDFESLLDRWRIGVAVGRDDLGGLQGTLAGALANAGVRYVEAPTLGDYLLKAELDSEEFTSDDGWYWVRGTLNLSLVEVSSGAVVGSHRWPFKSSARQASGVAIRARARLDELLQHDLLKVLAGFGDIDDKS